MAMACHRSWLPGWAVWSATSGAGIPYETGADSSFWNWRNRPPPSLSTRPLGDPNPERRDLVGGERLAVLRHAHADHWLGLRHLLVQVAIGRVARLDPQEARDLPALDVDYVGVDVAGGEVHALIRGMAAGAIAGEQLLHGGEGDPGPGGRHGGHDRLGRRGMGG